MKSKLIRVFFSLGDGDEGKFGVVFDATGLSEQEIEDQARDIAFNEFDWSYDEIDEGEKNEQE